jgi:hypothetical protein
MDVSQWTLAPLAGLALVVMANLLRFRRTEDRGCLGHLFIAAESLTRPEWALNRAGIAVFALGVVVSLAV